MVGVRADLQFTRQMADRCMTLVINHAVGCRYFLSYPRLPSQLQIVTAALTLLVEMRHVCEPLAQCRCMTAEWLETELAISGLLVQCPSYYVNTSSLLQAIGLY